MADTSTNHEKMEGETVLEQHDSLHRQISAFEKLLQHAMNKFSREKLYGMLKLATKDFSSEYKAGDHVYSIAHLKRIIEQIEMPLKSKKEEKQKPLSQDTERHVIKYFKAFFADVDYLKELKKYFDEKIYICLYEYFYDPLDDIQESELEALMGRYDGDTNTESQTQHVDDKNTESQIETEQKPVLPEEDQKEEEITFDFLSTKGKLSHAVRQMFKVNEKWDNILNDSNPHMECYDPDSKYELLIFNDHAKYESVLRLVPDMFVKAYKSVELAKLWWTHANKVYASNTPRRRRTTVKDLNRQEGELSVAIDRVSEDIKRIEETLVSRERDLEELIKRENRYNLLNDQCEKLEERKDIVTQTYNSITNEMHVMKQELLVLVKGTKQYTELEERLKEKDKKLMLTEDELKVLAYHFHIMQEDFNLEMELQPHLIRFKADIEDKVIGLKQDIEDKIGEKRKTEKIMVLLKTNCDRMKQIMQKLNLMDDEESFVEGSDTLEKPTSDIVPTSPVRINKKSNVNSNQTKSQKTLNTKSPEQKKSSGQSRDINANKDQNVQIPSKSESTNSDQQNCNPKYTTKNEQVPYYPPNATGQRSTISSAAKAK